MIIRVLAGTLDCRDGNCPTVYVTDHDTVVVQGYETTEVGAVQMPSELLLRAIAALAPAEAARCTSSTGTQHPRGSVLLRGNPFSSDARAIRTPAREVAVEISWSETIAAARDAHSERAA